MKRLRALILSKLSACSSKLDLSEEVLTKSEERSRKSKGIRYLGSLFLLMIMIPLQAKFYAPEFEDQFQKWIKRHRLAVVHFNPFDIDADIPDLDRMKLAFKNLADSARYKDADVAFIGVNLPLTPDLATVYDIRVPSAAEMKNVNVEDEDTQAEARLADTDIPKAQQATVILFKDGKPFTVGGKIAKRTGFLTKSQIRDFIETHFGDLIDNILQEKQEEIREQSRQVQQEQQQVVVQQPQRVQYVPQTTTQYVYYPERTYYRPYYGGYYGGWGRGWGRRGWGGGWGSGVGIGFGGRRGGFGIGFGW